MRKDQTFAGDVQLLFHSGQRRSLGGHLRRGFLDVAMLPAFTSHPFFVPKPYREIQFQYDYPIQYQSQYRNRYQFQ